MSRLCQCFNNNNNNNNNNANNYTHHHNDHNLNHHYSYHTNTTIKAKKEYSPCYEIVYVFPSTYWVD